MTEKNELPILNVNMDKLPAKPDLVKGDELVNFYKNIMDDIEKDRDEIDDALRNFTEMVFNTGDPSKHNTEAVVNLLKIKSETADKKTKVMELLMRSFLKESFPRYLAVKQENHINKRELLKTVLEEDNGKG